jgi:hypothetical protein
VRIAAVASIVLALLGACSTRDKAEHVDLDLIRIVGEARMRTDTVGDGKFSSSSSFVLVDAENTSDTGAYVTLAGSWTDAGGAAVAPLKPQSLWIPPKETRTYALVDAGRKPRPTATSAKLEVRGALIASPPRAQITDVHTFDDRGKAVIQASLTNNADRRGTIIVIASFHDKEGSPMTRPFTLYELSAKQKVNVQFVGPQGSTRAAIYLGDETY